MDGTQGDLLRAVVPRPIVPDRARGGHGGAVEETPAAGLPGSRVPASRLAALSSSPIAPLSTPPPPRHPGADDPLRVVPEARRKLESAPHCRGRLARARSGLR